MLRAAELPAAMRWTIDLEYYASETDRQFGLPSAHSNLSLPRLNMKRLGVRPVPATQADADALASLAAQGATQLSPYAISVKPQLQLDGASIAEAPAQRMGDTVYWSLTVSGPGQSPRTADYKLNSGDEFVIGVNAIGIDAKQHQIRHAQFNAINASNNLQQAALAFWAQHDVYDELLATTAGQATQRLPSAGVFATRLNVRYFLGVPTTGYYSGRSMDVRQNLRTNSGGTTVEAIKVAVESGIHGSYLEGFTLDVLFDHQRGTGLSATGILQSLQAQGAKIYKIDASNIAVTLPNIQASASVKTDINNAVAAGQYAVIAERELTQGQWSGTGYYLIDPDTGAGAYLIDGGYAGGDEGADCQMRPVSQPGSQSTTSFFTKLFAALALLLLAKLAIDFCRAALPVCVGAGALGLAGAASAQMPGGPPLSPLTSSQQTVWDAFLHGRPWPSNAPGFGFTEDKPNGSCEPDQHEALENASKAACRQAIRCDSGADCDQSVIEQKVAGHEDCIAKRLPLWILVLGAVTRGIGTHYASV